MAEAIIQLVEDIVSSPWIYLVLFAVAAVDGFFPVVPSEASVLTAGVFAASGETSLPLVILAAVLGAFAGDQISYAFGHLAGPRVDRRAGTAGRRRAALDKAGAALAARGGVIIIVSRYFPGARTAVTLTAGAVGYRWQRFAGFGAIAAVTWGTYSALIGYVGGAAFESDPLKGLLLGFGLAAAVTVTAELGRHVVQRRRAPIAACSVAPVPRPALPMPRAPSGRAWAPPRRNIRPARTGRDDRHAGRLPCGSPGPLR